MTDNREIVLEALLLHDKGEYADKIIKNILDKYSYLERFERSFINRVFTGTIERKLYLDFIINNFSSVKVNKQKPVIRAILRMSTYQILFMDSVPDSAAINEAVKLAKKKKFAGLSGFVNGVLRKIAKENTNVAFPKKDVEPVKYLSIMYSAPEWLCEHFISETDLETAEKILANSIVKRPVIVRTNISKTTPSELKSELVSDGVKVTELTMSDSAFIIDDIDGLSSINSFNDGMFCVQDLSSQSVLNVKLSENLASEIFGNMKTEEAENKLTEIIKTSNFVIDVCAAPGGKTCHIADLLQYYKNDSCRVISRDLTDSKADKIDDNISRCGFENVETEVWDALTLDESLIGKADLVIADLPCSGLGVIGRKADIKYRVTKDELSQLANLQKDILRVVSQYVKPGGILIYSTCTVNRLENIDNAKWIKSELNFTPLGNAVQLLNVSSENDGFFISRFIKN